jgi:type II secretory pathway pseudopilin PulG
MDKTVAALELRDIHLPAEPGIWPLAIGWWLMILVSLIVIYFVYKFIQKQNKKRQLVNLMQQQLQSIQDEYKQHQDKHKLAIAISELLKRFVRHILGDNNATALTGDKWIAYLNDQVDGNTFTTFKIPLTQAQYVPSMDYDVPSLIARVKNFFPQVIKNKVRF